MLAKSGQRFGFHGADTWRYTLVSTQGALRALGTRSAISGHKRTQVYVDGGRRVWYDTQFLFVGSVARSSSRAIAIDVGPLQA